MIYPVSLLSGLEGKGQGFCNRTIFNILVFVVLAIWHVSVHSKEEYAFSILQIKECFKGKVSLTDPLTDKRIGWFVALEIRH